MKLSKAIKEKIDSYFENISAEELYNISITRYNFKERNEIDFEDQSFELVGRNIYNSSADNSIDVTTSNTMPLAA